MRPAVSRKIVGSNPIVVTMKYLMAIVTFVVLMARWIWSRITNRPFDSDMDM
jgi:hypothetical protein